MTGLVVSLRTLPLDLTRQTGGHSSRAAVPGWSRAAGVPIANAGHLAPYWNGREMDVESGLPLGVAPEAVHAVTAVEFIAASAQDAPALSPKPPLPGKQSDDITVVTAPEVPAPCPQAHTMSARPQLPPFRINRFHPGHFPALP